MFHLSAHQLSSNIISLQSWMAKRGLDFMYLSGADTYLSEYVPREETHRYYVTGFTGSVAHVLVPQNGKVLLFVDGRYTQQAELEVNHNDVTIRKGGLNLRESLLEELEGLQNKNIILGLESDRTPFSWAKKFRELVRTQSIRSQELADVLHYRTYHPQRNHLVSVEKAIPGEGADYKIAQIIKRPKQGFYLSSLDQVAWATHVRGFQLPFSSPFLAKALVTEKTIYVFHPEVFEIEDSLAQNPKLTWVCTKQSGILEELSIIQTNDCLETIFYDPDGCTIDDVEILEKVFGQTHLTKVLGGIVHLMARKTETEMKAIRQSFDRADKSIFGALSEIRKRSSNNELLTEHDLKETCERHYAHNGAICQSFNTIASFGDNSAIIHYGKASRERSYQKGEWMLLDSGGHFAPGMATDTTRTMMVDPGETPSARAQEIYTLVLKSYINAHRAVFKEGTMGAVIDGLARYPMNQLGLNYEHGTGHGVGISVHEGGVNFRANSHACLHPGQVVSLEPGLYFPGEMGCRFENIVEIIVHPQFPEYLCFKSLVYIGVDPKLVDQALLNEQELEWLENYENECQARGRSFGWKKLI